MHVFLETQRLILRRFTDADVDHLVALDSDPAVMQYLSGGPPTPREAIERDVLPAILGDYGRVGGFGFWAAIETSTGAFIGWFHLRPHPDVLLGRPEVVELGYRLKRSAWGKGYATEGSRALVDKGFAELGVHRVVAFTYGPHLASRRVMEKVGMRLTRTYRPTPEDLLKYLGVTDPSLFDGDDVEYAITRDEWDHQRAAERASAP
jgi:RimJ/RimL family protein N-acetyltransferase